jgi:hypothetical protein
MVCLIATDEEVYVSYLQDRWLTFSRSQSGLGKHDSLVETAYFSEDLAQGWYVHSFFSSLCSDR